MTLFRRVFVETSLLWVPVISPCHQRRHAGRPPSFPVGQLPLSSWSYPSFHGHQMVLLLFRTAFFSQTPHSNNPADPPDEENSMTEEPSSVLLPRSLSEKHPFPTLLNLASGRKIRKKCEIKSFPPPPHPPPPSSYRVCLSFTPLRHQQPTAPTRSLFLSVIADLSHSLSPSPWEEIFLGM